MLQIIQTGILYRTPAGEFVRVYSWDSAKKVALYHHDDGKLGNSVDRGRLNTWTPMPELMDFPERDDPRLPYPFNVFFDLDTASALVLALSDEDRTDVDEIRLMMGKHGITEDSLNASLSEDLLHKVMTNSRRTQEMRERA